MPKSDEPLQTVSWTSSRVADWLGSIAVLLNATLLRLLRIRYSQSVLTISDKTVNLNRRGTNMNC